MSAWSRVKLLVSAIVAFVAGQIGWVLLAGVLAATADSAGLVYSHSAWAAPGPLVGLAAAAYVLGVFD